MKYVIKSSTLSGMKLAEDGLSINIDMTITYNTEEESKMQDSSTGCSINIPLESGERSTMLAELDKAVLDWFNENYNPK